MRLSAFVRTRYVHTELARTVPSFLEFMSAWARTGTLAPVITTLSPYTPEDFCFSNPSRTEVVPLTVPLRLPDTTPVYR